MRKCLAAAQRTSLKREQLTGLSSRDLKAVLLVMSLYMVSVLSRRSFNASLPRQRGQSHATLQGMRSDQSCAATLFNKQFLLPEDLCGGGYFLRRLWWLCDKQRNVTLSWGKV